MPLIPFNKEAEQSVLGAIMFDPRTITDILKILSPEDFFEPSHSEIYKILISLYTSQKSIDPVTIADELDKSGKLEKSGGISYIIDHINTIPTTMNAILHANIVKDKSTLRKILTAADEIKKMCFEENYEIDNILNQAEQKIFNISQSKISKDFVHIKKLLEMSLDRIDEISKNPNKITGISTGFDDIDRITLGLQKGDLILVAARPAMGKTSFVTNIAEHAAINDNATVAMFSLEMPAIQIATRIISSNAMLNSHKLRSGDLEDNDWPKIYGAMTRLTNCEIYVDDTAGIGISEIFSKCRKMKIEKKLDLIVIDYLQLMTPTKHKENRQQEITEISRSIKILALTLEVPVILLSQLSRGPESRTDHRPMLSDLRESGAIEQDADIVMFLYRDYYYNKASLEPNLAECIISKHRNGELGTICLRWCDQYTKFANWSDTFENF